MLQFKKPIYLALLAYGKNQVRLPLLIFCSSCLPRYHLRTLFLILFSLTTYVDSSVSYAAGESGDGSAGRKRRSRSPDASATVPAVAEVQGGPTGAVLGPLLRAAPPAPAAGTPGDAADSAGGASGGGPDPKRSRVSGSCTSAAAALPAIVLSPEIASMFDLSGLDAEPIKRDLITRCLVEINGNRVGAILLRILGEQLGQYHRLMQAYSGAIARLKPHVTAAFFTRLNAQIAAIPEAAEEVGARGGPARGATARGRASRRPHVHARFQAKVAALKKLVGYEEEPEVERELDGLLASPLIISIISKDETCFNYNGPIPLFLLPENRRIGKLRVHLDFTKIHIFGGQPSSLTSCLGEVYADKLDKIAVGMHHAPYYLTIAHELTHTKHFLQSIGADIEHATQSVQSIYAACTAKGLTFELNDVFPGELRGVQRAPLEHMSYFQALNFTDYFSLGSDHEDFNLLAEEARKHQAHLSAADRTAGIRYEPLWNNLEERRTVIGPDIDGISELTLRLSAGIPVRYLYQETEKHLFEDIEIINRILTRNNTEQVTRIFGGPITLDQILEVSRRHAGGFVFRLFYALA